MRKTRGKNEEKHRTRLKKESDNYIGEGRSEIEEAVI